MLGKVAALRCPRAWGTGSVLTAKKRLEAKGRDHGGFIALGPSLAISKADVLFALWPFDPRPEPAACT